MVDMMNEETRTCAIIDGTRGELEQQAAKALEHLQVALTCAKNAKAPRTVARIKHAISSANGAVRAASYRDSRAREAAT